MTDKELRRLSRSELLEMLIVQTEENSQLKIRLKQAEAQLRDRRIEIDKAGSLAEAAPRLSIVRNPFPARSFRCRSTFFSPSAS